MSSHEPTMMERTEHDGSLSELVNRLRDVHTLRTPLASW
jgi:hypothetical protein